VEGRVYSGLQQLIALRKGNEVFSGGELHVLPTENDHVLGFMREHGTERAVILANFSENTQTIHPQWIESLVLHDGHRLHGTSSIPPGPELRIEALDFLVFKLRSE
jgi:glycosidase